MPSGRSSSAIDLTNPTIACFVAQYSAVEKVPEKPASDAVINITPVLFYLSNALMAIREKLQGMNDVDVN